MIEVKYDSDLEEDIEIVNGEFNPKYVYEKTGIIGLAMASAGICAFGLGAIPVDAINIFCVAGGASLVYFGGNSIANVILKKRFAKKVERVNNDFFDLANTLSENKDVNVVAANLREAISFDKEVTTTTREDFENNTMSKEEKLIKYIYLLDENDQYQVLKQIGTDRNHNNIIDNTEYETFLLEEEDLIGHKMPVRKRIAKK